MTDDDDSTETPPEPAAKKPAGKRSTAATVAQRVEQVLKWRLAGASFADLREYAGESGWGVSDSMLRKYIAESNALLKEQSDRSASRSYRLHLARREFLYSLAVKGNDLRVALDVLRDAAKLEDLYDDVATLQKELGELSKIIRNQTAGHGDWPGELPPPAMETPADGRQDPAR